MKSPKVKSKEHQTLIAKIVPQFLLNAVLDAKP